MIAELIYVLCAATSFACFVLLLRGYRRTRSRLLLWGSASFLAFTVANILLVIDRVVLPEVDLELYREISTFIAVALLLCGLALNS
ncbi:MAG TPA: DUF5985 family protein [Opitutaceae bacterium]|nr:DUF5985 family protein [Opitutaceae bacterium]